MHKKSLVILGAGESGIGAALLAKKQGFEVFVSDDGPIRQDFKDELILNKIDFEEGGHTEQRKFSFLTGNNAPHFYRQAVISFCKLSVTHH